MSRPLEWRGRYALVESHTVPVTHSGEPLSVFWFDGLSDIRVKSKCPLTQLTLRMGELTILSYAKLCEHSEDDTYIYKFRQDFRGSQIEMPWVLNTSYFECRGRLQCCYEPATAPILVTCKTVVVPMDLYNFWIKHYLVDVKFLVEKNTDPPKYQLWE